MLLLHTQFIYLVSSVFKFVQSFPCHCAGAAPCEGADNGGGAGVGLAVRGRQEEGVGRLVRCGQSLHPGWPPMAGCAPGPRQSCRGGAMPMRFQFLRLTFPQAHCVSTSSDMFPWHVLSVCNLHTGTSAKMPMSYVTSSEVDLSYELGQGRHLWGLHNFLQRPVKVRVHAQ